VTTHTSIGAATRITAGGDLAVLAATDITGLRVETKGGTGGLVAVGGQLAEVNFTAVEATVDLAAGVKLAAAGAVTIGSDTASTFAADADQTAMGVVAKDEVQATITAVESATTSLSDSVEITGASIDVTALVSRAGADAEATADARGVGAGADARAHVDLDIDAKLDAHLPLLTAPHVEILAATRGLDTYVYSNAKANAVGVDLYSTAYNDATEDATINLSSGLITTRDLWVTADTITGQSADALAVYDSGNFASGVVTYGSSTDIQRTTQISTNTAVLDDLGADGKLVLEIDSTGAAVRNDGIPWHQDLGTGSIVVEDFFYNGSQEPPQARFVVNGPDEISNWIAGNPVFTVQGADEAGIINESINSLELGFIGAGVGGGPTWNIQVVSPNNYLAPTTDTLASYPSLLEVRSVGDILLNGAIDIPHAAGLVDISSEGNISGTGSIRAAQIDLDAGGDIGSSANPLGLAPGSLPLSVVAGGDMAITIAPTLASTTDSMTVDTLQSGGDMEVLVSPAVQDYNGETGPMATRVVFSGPVTAGGNISMQIMADEENGGSIYLNGPVTAGGSISIDPGVDMLINSAVTAGGAAGTVDLMTDGSIYTGPASRITALETASLTAGGSIYADSAALITGHDLVLHADDSVGQWASALTVSLTGGGLSAYGGQGVYVQNQGGPLTVDYLFSPDGGASLTARDTAGNNDLIVMEAGATMNTKGDLRLAAGDGISLATGDGTSSAAFIQSNESITLVLDADETDPDPGSGVTFDFTNAHFDSPVIRIQTGVDDDIIRVEDLPEAETVLDINTGAGDDQLRLGDTGQVLNWLSGTILFDGGAGSDSIIADNSKGGVGDTGTLWLDSASTMAYRGAVIPLIRMSGMGDLWYLGVEDIDISLGLPEVENIVDVDGTAAEVATVNIVGTSAKETFRVGNGMARLLSGVHGVITFDGGTAGEDSLQIIENNFQSGLSFTNDLLTATAFTGQGMDGSIEWNHISTLSLSLLGNTDLTIAAAPVAATTVAMGTGTTEHSVTIGDGHLGDTAGKAAFPAGRSLSVTAAGSNYTMVLDDHLDADPYTAMLNASGFSINSGLWPLFSGFGKNRVLLGDGGGTVFVQGSPAGLALATIVGGTSNDLIDVSALPAGTVLDVQGGAGDDELRIAGTAALQATAAPVIFQGGEGTDIVWISANDATASIPSLFLDQPGTNPWPYMGSSLAAVRGLGMTNGVYYEAEKIDITLTNQVDTAYLKATTEGTQSVTIRGGDGSDNFYLGGADALTNLHGDLNLWGGNDTGDRASGGSDGGDRMWIEDQDSTMDFDTGTGFDSVLGLGTFIGQGLDGTINYSEFEDLGVFLGSGKDSLAIDAVHSNTWLQVNMGGGDDRLSVGYASGLSAVSMDVLGLAGGTGNDELIISDAGDTTNRSAFIQGRNIQGLTPGEGQIVIGSDFESMGVTLGSGTTNLEVIDPSIPITIRGTDGAVNVNVTSLQSAQSVTFYGGSANDTLHVGDVTDALNVYGAVRFFGGAGNDAAYVYELASEGTVWFEGDAGADSLHIYQFFTYAGGASGYTTQFIDGAVLFFGGEGTDGVVIKQTLVQANDNTVRFDSTAAPGYGLEMGHIGGLEMEQGVWYDAEDLNVQLEGRSDSANQIYIDATAEGLETLTAEGGSYEDQFHVGEAIGSPLSRIHGDLVLNGGDGYEDSLNIDNADDTSGWSDITLTSTGFTGMGLPGAIVFSDIAWVTVTPGNGADEIWLESVPYMDFPDGYGRDTSYASINNLNIDDVVFMSESVGHQIDFWKLNGESPIGVSASSSLTGVEPAMPGQTVQVTAWGSTGTFSVWASQGYITPPSYASAPYYNYWWQADRSVDQDVVVYAQRGFGPKTATRFHVDITNIPPTVTVPDQTVNEGTVSPAYTITDPGQGVGETITGQWQIVNRSTGAKVTSDPFPWYWPPTFSLAAGTYDITLSVTDSEATLSTSSTLTVNNVAPTVNAGPDVDGDQRAVELNGTVTDPGIAGGETVTSHWVVTDAQGHAVDQSDSLNWTFQAPAFGIYTATLTATDSNGATTSDSAVLDLYNIAPTVDAGSDVESEPLAVQLHGTVTDPGTAHGETVTYHWVVTDGEGHTLAQSDSLNWTFQSLEFGLYTATLTATDQYGLTSSDTAVLTVVNKVPTVDAGLDTTIQPGTPVTLAGSFADPGQGEGETYDMTWTVYNNAGLLVAAKQGSSLTFTTHTAGDYTAILSVTDSNGGVGTDTCTITVAAVLPVVNAGADVSVDLNAGPVTLTGSFTDPAAEPNEAYTAGWIITNSSGAQVAAGTGLSMTYTPAAIGTYSATLTVTDSDGNSGSDARTITVSGAHFRIQAGTQIVAYAGENTGTVEVARFGDNDLGYRPADWYQATINWGDGTPSSGTLTWVDDNGWFGAGYWRVEGSHTYVQNSYDQPDQVYQVTTTVLSPANSGQYGIPHDRTAVITNTASINTRAPVITGYVFPDVVNAEVAADLTVTFGDGLDWPWRHDLKVFWGESESTWQYYSMTNTQRSITVSHTYSATENGLLQFQVLRQDGSATGSSSGIVQKPFQVAYIPAVEAGADATVQERAGSLFGWHCNQREQLHSKLADHRHVHQRRGHHRLGNNL
jgi:hypothetical protein